MKIILIHNKYFLESGPESYLFNIEALLRQEGHQVIPFSLNYSNNKSTEYAKYFVNPIGDPNIFRYSEQDEISVLNKLKILKNAYYNEKVYKSLEELINIEKPDIAYLLQFWGKLSPSVIKSCKDNKVPVVLRLSDYGLICSKNIMFRNNSVCDKCTKNRVYSIFHKCVENSYIKSTINFSLNFFFYFNKYYKKIDSIIVPSKKMQLIFGEYQYYKSHKIKKIQTFIPKSKIAIKSQEILEKKYDFIYFGRISEDKGLHILVDALINLSSENIYPSTIIIGDLNNHYAKKIVEKVQRNKLSVNFKGFLKRDKLVKHLKSSNCSIVPSVWYDNMPNALIEAQANAVPCIASNIGSLPELIKNNFNGMLFNPGNSNDLAQKMKNQLNMTTLQKNKMSKNSIDWALNFCDEDKHYKKLIGVFNDVLSGSEN